jgi:ABC-type transport system involved in cytochrome bd biosynthesis fused ATPase/permease subunit
MNNKQPTIEVLESWKKIIELKKSKKIIIKGQSGVGKSSLLNYLKKNYSEKAMLVDSKSSVFDGTIEENVLIGRKINYDLDQCLKIVFVENLKLQDKSANISNESLSAGQIQRIALLRDVILSNNKIVMLDEPTSALDEKSEERVGFFLENYFQIMSIEKLIISTHSEKLEKYLSGTEIVYLSS